MELIEKPRESDEALRKKALNSLARNRAEKEAVKRAKQRAQEAAKFLARNFGGKETGDAKLQVSSPQYRAEPSMNDGIGNFGNAKFNSSEKHH